MKIYSVMIFNRNSVPMPTTLAVHYELGDFGIFQRGSVREFLRFVSREVTSRSAAGSRCSVLHKEHLCHCYVGPDNLAVAVITDEEYPWRVAFALIKETLDQFLQLPAAAKWEENQKDVEIAFPKLASLVEMHLDPVEAGKQPPPIMET
mmetsp:Transcript_10300/g.25892  ORF Transcript_10300/g.25892 Transcript_10300/m.25892 type:complete len:149 (+) Transcript_10300:81-527(+)